MVESERSRRKEENKEGNENYSRLSGLIKGACSSFLHFFSSLSFVSFFLSLLLLFLFFFLSFFLSFQHSRRGFFLRGGIKGVIHGLGHTEPINQNYTLFYMYTYF
jgi:hypothetical protein